MPRNIGETPNERATRESIRDELDMKGRKLGEYIDEFTTVVDTCTTDEIMDRVPKCCIVHVPKPSKPYTLKPAPKHRKTKPMKMVNRRLVWEKSEQQLPNRAKQKHQEQI